MVEVGTAVHHRLTAVGGDAVGWKLYGDGDEGCECEESHNPRAVAPAKGGQYGHEREYGVEECETEGVDIAEMCFTHQSECKHQKEGQQGQIVGHGPRSGAAGSMPTPSGEGDEEQHCVFGNRLQGGNRQQGAETVAAVGAAYKLCIYEEEGEPHQHDGGGNESNTLTIAAHKPECYHKLGGDGQTGNDGAETIGKDVEGVNIKVESVDADEFGGSREKEKC